VGQYADLWTDAVFWTAAKNTLIWVIVGASSQFLLGPITALTLNRPGLRALGLLAWGCWLMRRGC
jgi:ABC-type sugar transport system permease subunit